jgi:drug/metabolite transporter (DMT)-like permease
MRIALITALAMIAFAGNSILNRLAVGGGHTDPESFAVVRLLAGALMLLGLAYRRGASLRQPLPALGIGGASLTLYMLGFSLAYQTLDAGLGALILFGVVQFTMFAWNAARSGGVSPLQLTGGGFALVGLGLVLWPSGALQIPLEGAALMALAGIGWGIYSITGRGVQDPLGATAGNFCLSLIMILPVLPLLGWDLQMNATGLLLAVLSGAVTSGIGYALWYSVLPSLSAPLAATIQLSVPVLAIVAGVLLLGETMTLRALIGSAVVLAGIALVLRAGRPARG